MVDPSVEKLTICILCGNLRYGGHFLLRLYLGIQGKKVVSSRHFHISRHRKCADPRYSRPVLGFFKIDDFGA